MMRKGKWRALAGAGAASALLAAGLSVGSPATAETVTGCGYGVDGPSADAICWIDMSQFDATKAATPEGQALSLNLGDGITVDTTAHLTPGQNGLRPIEAVAFPTWRDAILGNYAYKNTPGSPALYQVIDQSTSGETGTITLDNIRVALDGTPQPSGFAFVIADAESTNATVNYTEGFSWKASSPLNLLRISSRRTITPVANPRGWAQPS